MNVYIFRHLYQIKADHNMFIGRTSSSAPHMPHLEFTTIVYRTRFTCSNS